MSSGIDDDVSLMDDLDTDDISGDDLSKGGAIAKEGWFHFCVEDAKYEASEKENGTGCFVFRCKAYAGEHSSEVNKSYYHRLWNSKKKGGREQRAKFACGLSLTTAEEVDQNPNVKINWGAARGRQYVAQIELEKGDEYTDDQGNKKQGKDKYLVRFNRIYHPLDPAVAEVPKDPDLLGLLEAVGQGEVIESDGTQQAAPGAGSEQKASQKGPAPGEFEDI